MAQHRFRPSQESFRSHLRGSWVLYLALAATVFAYAPSLDSPFYGDDYIYLVAARELSFGEYARAVLTPWGNEPLLPFTRDFWRPLAFLVFEVAEPVFGGRPWPYHLVNLAIHLASIVLVWLLASKLDHRPAVRALATLIFALYPGSFEAVTWISSVNSLGLPFALGSWLAFLTATREPETRWGFLGLSVALLALSLCCRESGTALVPAMALWYLLVQRRDQLRVLGTYLPWLPFAALGIAYFLLRTRLLAEPFANPDIYGVDSDYLERWWFYMKNALLPFRDPVTGWREPAQHAAGMLLLGLPVFALLRKRWDVLALSVGLILSTLPYGATLLGVGQRYFYFSTPALALGAGILAVDLDAARRGSGVVNVRRFAYPAVVALLVVAGVFSTGSRIRNWIEIAPDRQQRWVDGLRAEHPELREDGTLYCANVPLILAVFDAANLGPTVRWYYPKVGQILYHTAPERPILGPNDRFFDASPAGVSSPQP